MTAIAELLALFNGKSGDYEVWERQAKFLKTAHRLGDDTTKIMIGMRLKGKALDWMHSKPEHITMTTDELFEEMRGMFWLRQNKLTLRKAFENRVWKEDETFNEYLHDKTIMGNRFSIDKEELLDYVIDGIPNETLRNQARMQRFTTTDALQEALGKTSLHEQNTMKSNKGERQNSNRAAKNLNIKTTSDKETKAKRCFNCGQYDHLSNNCPSKERAQKCFGCNEYGHIAAKCMKKSVSKDSCAVTRIGRRKCLKEIVLDGSRIEALIDSASDLTLMRADEFLKRGSPLEPCEVTFRGIESKEITALGKFDVKITIDDRPPNSYLRDLRYSDPLPVVNWYRLPGSF